MSVVVVGAFVVVLPLLLVLAPPRFVWSSVRWRLVGLSLPASMLPPDAACHAAVLLATLACARKIDVAIEIALSQRNAAKYFVAMDPPTKIEIFLFTFQN